MDQSEQLKDIIDRLSQKIGDAAISLAAAESAATYWQGKYKQAEEELNKYKEAEGSKDV